MAVVENWTRKTPKAKKQKKIFLKSDEVKRSLFINPPFFDIYFDLIKQGISRFIVFVRNNLNEKLGYINN